MLATVVVAAALAVEEVSVTNHNIDGTLIVLLVVAIFRVNLNFVLLVLVVVFLLLFLNPFFFLLISSTSENLLQILL